MFALAGQLNSGAKLTACLLCVLVVSAQETSLADSTTPATSASNPKNGPDTIATELQDSSSTLSITNTPYSTDTNKPFSNPDIRELPTADTPYPTNSDITIVDNTFPTSNTPYPTNTDITIVDNTFPTSNTPYPTNTDITHIDDTRSNSNALEPNIADSTGSSADSRATNSEAAPPSSSIADPTTVETTISTSTAVVTPPSVLCDTRGIKKVNIDDTNAGSCVCKDYVTGELCGKCIHGAFDLQEWRDTGCAKCYCSGFSTDCELRSYPVTQFSVPIHQIQLLELGTPISPITVGLTIDELGEATYASQNESRQEFYWSLPSKLLSGDKIGSYGMYLNWTQRFDSKMDTQTDLFAKLVIISADGTSLTWTNSIPFNKNTNMDIHVQLNEQYLKTEIENETQSVSREKVMRVLSSIKWIFIRAIYASQLPSTHIRNIIMDVVLDNAQAVDPSEMSSTVTKLESCTCPEGYSGRSCETCAARFYREKSTTDGSATCKKCPCNGNEDQCSVSPNSTEIICNCNANFTGKKCEEPIQPPSIVQRPSNITVLINEAAVLNCSAANTSATYTRWEFTAAQNNSSAVSTNEKRLYGADNFKLNNNFQIARVSSKDEGWYTCVVFNSKGSDSATAYLKVTNKTDKARSVINHVATNCLKVATGLLCFLCIMVILPIILLWVLDYRAKKRSMKFEITELTTFVPSTER